MEGHMFARAAFKGTVISWQLFARGSEISEQRNTSTVYIWLAANGVWCLAGIKAFGIHMFF